MRRRHKNRKYVLNSAIEISRRCQNRHRCPQFAITDISNINLCVFLASYSNVPNDGSLAHRLVFKTQNICTEVSLDDGQSLRSWVDLRPKKKSVNFNTNQQCRSARRYTLELWSAGSLKLQRNIHPTSSLAPWKWIQQTPPKTLVTIHNTTLCHKPEDHSPKVWYEDIIQMK